MNDQLRDPVSLYKLEAYMSFDLVFGYIVVRYLL